MQFQQLSLASSTFLVSLLLSALQTTISTPLPQDEPAEFDTDDFTNSTLEIRQNCPVTCGYYGQLCCQAGQYCFTDSNNQAQCGGGSGGAAAPQLAQDGSGNGQYQVYTTTYTQTGLQTVTSTYSLLVANVQTAAAPAGSGAYCNVQMGYQVCGGLCCDPGQFCNQPGECVGTAGTTVGAAGGAPAPTNSAYIRPTSGTVVTQTTVGTATTTLPFQTPVGTDGSMLSNVTAVPANNGLSPGAIAGIVIGVLFGLFLLFLLLAFLCCRGIWDAIFGRKRKRVTETYIEEHHHHGSGSGRPPPRRWFGILPGRSDVRPPPKKSSGIGGALGVAGFLGALAILLGLKRRRDRQDEKSSYTASSYTDSYYTTSESE